MNNDLISRKELRKAFKKLPFFTGAYLYYARQLIDNAPTINTTCPNCDSGYAQGYSDGYLKGKEERPHGKWEEPFEMNGKQYHKCTNCHISSELILIDKYCPNCGAKMDEKDVDNDN